MSENLKPNQPEQRIITSFIPFLFDVLVNRALRRGWRIKDFDVYNGFLGRLVMVVTLERP